MPSRRPRAIIFDIGRVLVRIDLRRSQIGLAHGLSLTPEELWSAIEKDPNWRAWQEGRFSPRDWHLALTKRLGIALDFGEFTKAWNAALDPVPILPDNLFERLSRSHRLGLLSNTDPIHVAFLESTYSFYRYFPKPVRTYSCTIGASKPDPLIFRAALRTCGVQAQEALYIDDVPGYVEAACRLGMQGVYFRSPEQLHQDFASRGISSL